jgi:hypothetical protein
MYVEHRCVATCAARTTENTAHLLLGAFASAGMCLPSRCLATNYSGFQTCQNIVLPPTSTYFLLSLSSAFSPKAGMHSSFLPCVLCDLPISSRLTSSLWSYLAKNTTYEGPHYTICSNLLFHLSSVLIFSSAPCSQITSVYSLPLMSETKFHAYKNLRQNYDSVYLNCYVFRHEEKTHGFELNGGKYYPNSVCF